MRIYLLVAYFVFLWLAVFFALGKVDDRRYGWIWKITVALLFILIVGGLLNLMDYRHPGHLT